MGSLETGIPLKRTTASTRIGRQSSLNRTLTICSRFLMFKRLDYVQWIFTVALFLVLVVFFQMFLPGSVVEKSKDSVQEAELIPENFRYLKEIGGFDFGEDIRIEPSKLLEKFKREGSEVRRCLPFTWHIEIECEPEYLMGDFGTNRDIDDKPPIPLCDALERAKPFLMAYKGIQGQEEWEVFRKLSKKQSRGSRYGKRLLIGTVDLIGLQKRNSKRS